MNSDKIVTMKKYIIYAFVLFLLLGCNQSDYRNVISAAVSKNPSAAFESFARNKSVQYIQRPQQLSTDIKSINKNLLSPLISLIKGVAPVWGEDNVKIPRKKEYVKYMQNYKSRALIDFDNGIITVETLDENATKKSLKNAIVTTLLLPDDPRSADLFGTKEIKLGETPYLLGEVKDDQNQAIRYAWRAGRYADILLEKNYNEKEILKNQKKVKVHYVTFNMVKDHVDVRVKKFKPFVEKYAEKYNVSENLVFAIMQTESNFNQFAMSNAGAFGLMQIVPTSAGKDAYRFVKGRSATPSKNYLFDANNNIELGVAYLHILDNKYFFNINNPVTKEYCVISAYNTGSGNVLRTFDSNRDRAKNIINSQTPAMIYNKLRSNLPYEETRRYLKKVVDYKRNFVNI